MIKSCIVVIILFLQLLIAASINTSTRGELEFLQSRSAPSFVKYKTQNKRSATVITYLARSIAIEVQLVFLKGVEDGLAELPQFVALAKALRVLTDGSQVNGIEVYYDANLYIDLIHLRYAKLGGEDFELLLQPAKDAAKVAVRMKIETEGKEAIMALGGEDQLQTGIDEVVTDLDQQRIYNAHTQTEMMGKMRAARGKIRFVDLTKWGAARELDAVWEVTAGIRRSYEQFLRSDAQRWDPEEGELTPRKKKVLKYVKTWVLKLGKLDSDDSSDSPDFSNLRENIDYCKMRKISDAASMEDLLALSRIKQQETEEEEIREEIDTAKQEWQEGVDSGKVKQEEEDEAAIKQEDVKGEEDDIVNKEHVKQEDVKQEEVEGVKKEKVKHKKLPFKKVKLDLDKHGA